MKAAFYFQGKKYEYFHHDYNTTGKNERAVEIPIIWDMVEKHKNQKRLGIGNVISHYFQIDYKVVDKYEKASGVINKDIVDYNPNERYGFIESISTLEHIGWDEEPKDPTKIIKAVEKITSLLAPKGKFITTIPLGYNPEIDKLIKAGALQFTETFYLKRISADNEWIETEREDTINSKYGSPYPWANGLFIGMIIKS